MSMTLDSPPAQLPESQPEARARGTDDPEIRAYPGRTQPERETEALTTGVPPRRGLLQRYQHHLWLGAASVAVIAAALSPVAIGYMSRPAATSASAPQSATL